MIRIIILKLKSILRGQRGESLTESLVSILIFVMLMEFVSTAIISAIKISEYAATRAHQEQASVNNAMMLVSGSPMDFEMITSPGGATISISVTKADSPYVYFAPVPEVSSDD